MPAQENTDTGAVTCANVAHEQTCHWSVNLQRHLCSQPLTDTETPHGLGTHPCPRASFPFLICDRFYMSWCWHDLLPAGVKQQAVFAAQAVPAQGTEAVWMSPVFWSKMSRDRAQV